MVIRSNIKSYLYDSRLLFCLRVLIGLIGSVALSWWWYHDPHITVPATLGVVAAASIDLDDGLSGRLLNLSLTIPCFFIASAATSLLIGYPIPFFLAIVSLTFGFTLLGVLGTRFEALAFGTLLIAVYTMMDTSSTVLWYHDPLLLILGALWYNLLALIVHLIFPIRPVQESLMECFYALGNYLDYRAQIFDPDEIETNTASSSHFIEANQRVVTTLKQAHIAITSRLKSKGNKAETQQMLNYYFTLWDINERANSTQINYLLLSKQLEHSDILFRFQRILSRLATSCRAIANSIKQQNVYEHDVVIERSLAKLENSLQKFHQGSLAQHVLHNTLQSSFANVEATNQQLKELSDNRPNIANSNKNHLINTPRSIKAIFQQLVHNLTPNSTLFRHAVRMSVVLGVSDIIIQVTQLPHAYWIMLTALLVCKPNYQATKKRVKYRVLGTLTGILIGSPLTYYLFPTETGKLFLIILTGVLFFVFLANRYAYATACVTILVLASLSLYGDFGFSVTIPRVIATLIGACIAWLGVCYIWPDWKFRQLTQIIKEASFANSNYLKIIALYPSEREATQERYYFSRQQAYLANTELNNAVANLTQQPHANIDLLTQSSQLANINHKILGYISTLGAQRRLLNDDPELIPLLENLNKLSDCLGLSAAESTPVDPVAIKTELSSFLDEHPAVKDSPNYILWQQLLAIADELPKWLQGYLASYSRN